MRKNITGIFTLVFLILAALPALAQHFGIKDRSLAAEVYDLHLSRLGGTSYLNDAWMRGAIEFTKKSLESPKRLRRIKSLILVLPKKPGAESKIDLCITIVESLRGLRKFSGSPVSNWRIDKTIRSHHEGVE